MSDFRMSAPKPKSKLDEVAEVIYNDTDNLFLTEFQATRLIRLTQAATVSDLEFIRAKKHRMVIYYLAGQYEKSKEELVSLIPYVANNLDLYIQVTAIALRIGAFLEISNIASKINISVILSSADKKRRSILEDLWTSFYLFGDYDRGVENDLRIRDFLKLNDEYDYLNEVLDSTEYMRNVYRNLNLDSNKVKKLFSVLEDVVVKNKVRILGVFHSTPMDDILIDLGVNNSLEEILKLNDSLFDLAYENDLINELIALSINFSPMDLESTKHEII